MSSCPFLYKEYHNKNYPKWQIWANCKWFLCFPWSKWITAAFPWYLSGLISQTLKEYLRECFPRVILVMISSINKSKKRRKRGGKRKERWKQGRKDRRKKGRNQGSWWMFKISWALCEILSFKFKINKLK